MHYRTGMLRARRFLSSVDVSMRFLRKCACSWPLGSLLRGTVNPTRGTVKSHPRVTVPGTDTPHPHDAKCRSGVNSLCWIKSVENALNRKLCPARRYSKSGTVRPTHSLSEDVMNTPQCADQRWRWYESYLSCWMLQPYMVSILWLWGHHNLLIP